MWQRQLKAVAIGGGGGGGGGFLWVLKNPTRSTKKSTRSIWKDPLERTSRSTITICLVNIDLDTWSGRSEQVLLSNQPCFRITHRKETSPQSTDRTADIWDELMGSIVASSPGSLWAGGGEPGTHWSQIRPLFHVVSCHNVSQCVIMIDCLHSLLIAKTQLKHESYKRRH